MTPSHSLAFAADPARARPLHVVRAEALAPFLAGPGAAWADWLAGFEAGLGELRLLPEVAGGIGAGGIGAAVVGLGTAEARRRQRFGLVKTLAALPPGDWALTGPLADPLTDPEKTEAALGWLLAGYRFCLLYTSPSPRDS